MSTSLKMISLFALITLLTPVFSYTELSDPDHCDVKAGRGDFSYNKNSYLGPDYWGEIKDEYKACKMGDRQSPIDFPLDVVHKKVSQGPQPKLHTANMSVAASSFNWAMRCTKEDTCGETIYGGETWHVLQMHFHSPSEHTLNGKRYPLEMHMVHQSEDGKRFAVIATMFDFPDEEGYEAMISKSGHTDYGENPILRRILEAFLVDHNTLLIPLQNLMQPLSTFCTYQGSLTTPPCTEAVTFLMQTTIGTVSRRQVYAYSVSAGGSYDGNNRPTQPMHKRKVTCYSKP